tara:strand:- start:596 stop:784 length:189 start_codon:yes stop_codon:yes gene_type:complete
MENWQIISVITIIIFLIIISLYYSLKKKQLLRKLKEGREVTEREKIRVYIDSINEKFRAKHK